MTTKAVNSLLRREVVAMDYVPDRRIREAQATTGLREANGRPIDLDTYISSRVPVLFFAGKPDAVGRTVWTIVVNAFDRVPTAQKMRRDNGGRPARTDTFPSCSARDGFTRWTHGGEPVELLACQVGNFHARSMPCVAG